MYTSRVSLCIGIVGVHPSYPSSPVGFYKPIMDISTPGSIYHHFWDFFSLRPRPCGKCALEPIAILYSALAREIPFLWWEPTSGDWRNSMGKHSIYRIYILFYRFKMLHWAYAQLLGCWRWSICISLCFVFLMGLDPTFGFDRLHSWTLRYVATEKWKDFTVGNRKFVLKFSGSEIPAITHVVPKTNVDIHVPLRGKLIPLFSEHY